MRWGGGSHKGQAGPCRALEALVRIFAFALIERKAIRKMLWKTRGVWWGRVEVGS